MPKIEMEVAAVSALREAASNPNAMELGDFALLVHSIRTAGFLQPILVRALAKGEYEVVDGHHRLRAAKELGLRQVPVVVVKDMSDAHAIALQLGMNKLRGSMDLAQVGHVLTQLKTDGWSVDDLKLTGFGPDEIENLVKSVQVNIDDMMMEEAAKEFEPPVEARAKPFLLELMFATSEDLKFVKRVLKKAGHGDLAAGLLAVVGGAE